MFLLISLCAVLAYGAEKKISDLDENAATTADDWLVVVNDAGTKVTKKAKVSTILSGGSAVTGSGTQYYIPYWTGTATLGKLADLGTSGYVLTSNGAGAAPTWQSVPGTGDVTGVGDCASGACYDGSSDGGTYISLYDTDSHKTTISAGNSTGDLTFVFPTAQATADSSMVLSSTAGALSYGPAIGTLTNEKYCAYDSATGTINCNSDGGTGAVATDTIWDAAGDTVYGTGANTSSRLAIGTAGQVYKVNSGATAPEWSSSLQAYVDDSAAQFHSATASKGTLKVLLSGSTDSKTLTLSSVHTDDKTLYIPDPTTGDSLAYGSAPIRFNTGAATARAKTISDAADTIAELGQANTFTATNTFTGAVTVGDGGDDVVTYLYKNNTDKHYSGTILLLNADVALAVGELVYVKSDGDAAKAKADAAATLPCIGIVVEAQATPGNPVKILTHGTLTNDSWAFTAGNIIHVSAATAGLATATAPSTSTNLVQRVGVALSDDTILFTGGLTTVTVP